MLCRRLRYAFSQQPVLCRRCFSFSFVPAKRVSTGTAADLFLQPVVPEPIETKTKISKPLEPKRQTSGSIVLDTVQHYTKKYPLCVLLVQVGDFYELYENHATKYASLLDLKLTRKKVANDQIVDFAGFPSRSLDRYVDMLVNRLGRRVALCEQLGTSTREDGSVIGMQRAITRIITPGTVIEERYLSAHANNYLLAILPSKNLTTVEDAQIGLAWVDLSVGEFVLQESSLQTFKDDITRIRPREVILPKWMENFSSIVAMDDGDNDADDVDNDEDTFDPVSRILATSPMIALTYQPDSNFDDTLCRSTLDNMFAGSNKQHVINWDTFGQQSLSAAAALLQYIEQTHVGRRPKLLPPTVFSLEDTLRIDSAAMTSLELLKGIKEGRRQDSLLAILDQTMTNAGSRLLSQWLSSPLSSIKSIEHRLDIVDYFYHHPYILTDVRYQLRQSTDAQRALQRLAMRRGQYSDLFEINHTFNVMKSIQQLFQKRPLTTLPASVHTMLTALDPHEDLIKDIQLAFVNQDSNHKNDTIILDEEGITSDNGSNNGSSETAKDYGYVNPDYTPTLRRLYTKLERLNQAKSALQNELSALCGRSLSLVSQSPFRHIIEVNASQAKKLESHYQHDQTLTLVHQTKSKRRYHLSSWTDISMQLDNTVSRIKAIEEEVFEQVVNRLLAKSNTVIQSCRVLAQLDTLTTFAHLSKQHDWVRPDIDSRNDMTIIGGRHPVVETYLGRKGRLFTRNDCVLKDNQRLWLLTGPNMGGKSTFLRQNAIIVVMGHMGCFVPARKASIGLTDWIFSRVGAADNLAQDQSTFMVEMTETATILKHATPKSLVVMDEVGRGTSTSDGFALAYAILDDLTRRIGCRTLFATHYHELADAVGSFDHLKCYKTSLFEDQSGFSFLHRVEPGVCRQSHGLKVAQVAGLPPSVVGVAQSVWQSLKVGSSLSPGILSKEAK